ncbi:hypothetical protein BDL97_03G099000 [Sphagnum fallax]|nr:hypothetical protein BDL97_03G099000 [Sphagnum fallax]
MSQQSYLLSHQLSSPRNSLSGIKQLHGATLGCQLFSSSPPKSLRKSPPITNSFKLARLQQNKNYNKSKNKTGGVIWECSEEAGLQKNCTFGPLIKWPFLVGCSSSDGSQRLSAVEFQAGFSSESGAPEQATHPVSLLRTHQSYALPVGEEEAKKKTSFPYFSKRNWMKQLLLFMTCLYLGAISSCGFRLSFVPSAAHAATAEIVIKARPTLTPTQKVTTDEKVIYALDYFFATEPGGKALILLAICAVLTAIGGVFYHWATNMEGPNLELPESTWVAWTFISDPGSHAGEMGFRRRFVAVPLSMGGMLFFALLISLTSDAVSARVDQLKKGSSTVLEENHTLIVGWTPKTIPLVKELTAANENRGRKRTIVVLGDREKVDMDADLRQALPLSMRNGSKVVTRTGVPTNDDDLKRCSASYARSMIILSPPDLLPHEADAKIIQTSLVLAYLPDLKADIVVELAELENVALLKQMLGTLMSSSLKQLPSSSLQASSPSVMTGPTLLPTAGERLQKMVPVATGDIVLRMMVERALKPGTAAVAGELLRFEGSEFRFKHWPELVGKTFGEIVYLFEDAIVCGMRTLKPTRNGSFTLINPPLDTVFQDGDRLLVISEDDGSYQPGKSNAPKHPIVGLSNIKKPKKPVIKMLICGWRHDLKDVLRLIDSGVAKGSEVTILSSINTNIRTKELRSGPPLQHLKVINQVGDPMSRHVLEQLPVQSYEKTIILQDRAKEGQCHDTTTTAMFIHHIQAQRGMRDLSILAELPSIQDSPLHQVNMRSQGRYSTSGSFRHELCNAKRLSLHINVQQTATTGLLILPTRIKF